MLQQVGVPTVKGPIMDIQLADVTVHIDENLDDERRSKIEEHVRAIDGVVSFHNPKEHPHLVIVQYDPAKVKSTWILDVFKVQGILAELIGL